MPKNNRVGVEIEDGKGGWRRSGPTFLEPVLIIEAAERRMEILKYEALIEMLKILQSEGGYFEEQPVTICHH